MFDEAIRQAEAFDVVGAEAGVVGRFKNRATEAAAERALLDRDNKAALFHRFENRLGIERLREASIDDTDVETIRPQFLGGANAIAEQRAEGNEHAIQTPFVNLGFAKFDRSRRTFDACDVRLWITDGSRTVVAHREIQHRRDIGFVAGSHHHEIREAAEVGVVERPMMCRAIGANQARTIQTQHDGQVLQRDLLKNLVKAALQERAVDINDWSHPTLRHAGRERDGVTFTDAGVEEAIGNLGANFIERVAGTHGGGQHADARVTFHR